MAGGLWDNAKVNKCTNHRDRKSGDTLYTGYMHFLRHREVAINGSLTVMFFGLLFEGYLHLQASNFDTVWVKLAIRLLSAVAKYYVCH